MPMPKMLGRVRAPRENDVPGTVELRMKKTVPSSRTAGNRYAQRSMVVVNVCRISIQPRRTPIPIGVIA